MPACPSGARPKASNAFSTAIIDVAKLGVYVLDYIYDKFPGALINNVLGTMSTSQLCSLNPDDPGPLLPEYFLADMTSGMVPSFVSPNGSVPGVPRQLRVRASWRVCTANQHEPAADYRPGLPSG
jgi:hypothetical protein